MDLEKMTKKELLDFYHKDNEGFGPLPSSYTKKDIIYAIIRIERAKSRSDAFNKLLKKK